MNKSNNRYKELSKENQSAIDGLVNTIASMQGSEYMVPVVSKAVYTARCLIDLQFRDWLNTRDYTNEI